jgi:hypothetical protein
VTLVTPVVTYRHETRIFTVGDINNLRVFGRQIVSKIFGRIQCKKVWRIKSNKKLQKLMKGQDIVQCTKAQRKNIINFVTECKIRN